MRKLLGVLAFLLALGGTALAERAPTYTVDAPPSGTCAANLPSIYIVRSTGAMYSCQEGSPGSWEWALLPGSTGGGIGLSVLCAGTGDRVAFQEALDTARLNGAGTVSIGGTGICEVDDELLYGSNTTIVGPGTIRLAAGASPPGAIFRPFDNDVHNVRFQGLILDQQGDGVVYGFFPFDAPTLDVNYTDMVTIDDVTFQDCISMCVWAHSEAGTGTTTGLQISNSRVRGSMSGGYSIFGSIGSTRITDNDVKNVGDDGIAVQDLVVEGDNPSVVVVSDNVVTGADIRAGGTATPCGIRIYGATDSTVTGNTVDKTVSCGISVSKGATKVASRATVTGNNVFRAGVASKYCSTQTWKRCSTDPDCGGGQTCDSYDLSAVPIVGIWIYDYAETAAVSSNTVNGSKGHGIKITGSGGGVSKLSVATNVSNANDAAGIVLEELTNFALVGNTTMNNGQKAGSNAEDVGILLASGAIQLSDGVVAANRSGDDQGTKTQLYGIKVTGPGGSLTNVQMYGNALEGNAGGSVGGCPADGAVCLFQVPTGLAFPAGAATIQPAPGKTLSFYEPTTTGQVPLLLNHKTLRIWGDDPGGDYIDLQFEETAGSPLYRLRDASGPANVLLSPTHPHGEGLMYAGAGGSDSLGVVQGIGFNPKTAPTVVYSAPDADMTGAKQLVGGDGAEVVVGATEVEINAKLADDGDDVTGPGESFSGLEFDDEGRLSMLRCPEDGQIEKWDLDTGKWQCAADAGGTGSWNEEAGNATHPGEASALWIRPASANTAVAVGQIAGPKMAFDVSGTDPAATPVEDFTIEKSGESIVHDRNSANPVKFSFANSNAAAGSIATVEADVVQTRQTDAPGCLILWEENDCGFGDCLQTQSICAEPGNIATGAWLLPGVGPGSHLVSRTGAQDLADKTILGNDDNIVAPRTHTDCTSGPAGTYVGEECWSNSESRVRRWDGDSWDLDASGLVRWNELQAANGNNSLSMANTIQSLAWTATGTWSDKWAFFLTNTSTSGSGNYVTIRQTSSSTAGTALGALLLLDNADTGTGVTAGLKITADAGGMTTGIDASDPEIGNAIALGVNNMTVNDGGEKTLSPSELALLDDGIAIGTETTGVLGRARGGTGADTSGFGDGLLGYDSGVATDVDTLLKVETALGAINIIQSTEVDASSELLALLGDETGSGKACFATAPNLVGFTVDNNDTPGGGVSVTSDGDGSIILTGQGDGSDEDLKLDLDNTSNKVVVSSSTGVDQVQFGTIGLKSAGAVDFTGAVVTLDDNELSPAKLSTEIRSTSWPAGSIITDDDVTKCGAVTAQQLNSGPRAWAFSCADSASSVFQGSTPTPNGWDGGAVRFELAVYHGTTETITFAGNFDCQCRGDGEIPSSTWGTPQAANVSITTANQIEFQMTADTTCAGTCAGSDMVFWRYTVDNGTFSTNAANSKVLAVKMEYVTNIGD